MIVPLVLHAASPCMKRQDRNLGGTCLWIWVFVSSYAQCWRYCKVLHIVTLFAFSLVCTLCCRSAMKDVCQISEKQVQKQSSCFFREILNAMLQCWLTVWIMLFTWNWAAQMARVHTQTVHLQTWSVASALTTHACAECLAVCSWLLHAYVVNLLKTML